MPNVGSNLMQAFAQAGSRGEKPQQREGLTHTEENGTLRATGMQSTGHKRTNILSQQQHGQVPGSATEVSTSLAQYKCY